MPFTLDLDLVNAALAWFGLTVLNSLLFTCKYLCEPRPISDVLLMSCSILTL